MKILIVSQYFWPENFRINDFAVWADEQGHNITVLTGMPNYPGGRFFKGYGAFGKFPEEYKGLAIKRTPLFPRMNGSRFCLFLNYVSFFISASLLGPIRCGRDFDVIFVYEPSPITVGFPAIVMKFWAKAPILFWVLDLWPDSLSATNAVRSPILLKFISTIVRFIYRFCDCVLVQSRAFFNNIEKHGVKKKNIKYFPSWAENHYTPGLSKSLLGSELDLPEGFYVLFTGNIGVAQDFESILAAATILKSHTDVHWLIVGDGRKYEWVKSEVKLRGLQANVHMVGRYPLEKMSDFLSFADVTLVSLKREPIFAQTIPGKVQSYLACGKPVIGMIDGEVAQLINDAKAGVSCPSESPEDLAAAVLKVYSMNAEDRETMGKNGREYYEQNFEREMLFERLEEMMRNIASQHTIVTERR